MSAHATLALGLTGPPPEGVAELPLRSAEAIDTRRRLSVGGFLLTLPRMVWMLLDAFLVCSGTVLGHELLVWWVDTVGYTGEYHLWLSNTVLASSVIVAGAAVGLYEPCTLWARSRILVRCLLAITIAMLATWLFLHLFMYSGLSRRAAACGTVFYLLTAPVVRLICHRAVQEVRRGLLVMGQGPLTGMIIRSVRRGRMPGFRLIGVVSCQSTETQGSLSSDIPIVGALSDVEKLCRQHEVEEIVVADSALRNPRTQKAALSCLRLGCRVTDETTFYETMFGEVPVSHISPHWFLAANLKGHRPEHAVLKRLFDVVLATTALVATAPLFLLIAIAIRLESRGGAFYSQRRVGQGGKVFVLHKFRTMHRHAESNGSVWAADNDPRVTRVGRVLRRLRLDELPQLWNIVRGEMSLVGPRPERPEFVGPLARLIPYYEERHLTKPGLTGWAQINYRYGASVADARQKLQLDLYYIKHTSLELDLVILLRTLGTFFRGAR